MCVFYGFLLFVNPGQFRVKLPPRKQKCEKSSALGVTHVLYVLRDWFVLSLHDETRKNLELNIL